MEASVRGSSRAKESVGDVDGAAEALHWAETVAAEGDYSFAVKWLDRADDLLGGLTPRYQKRRRDWRRAAERRGEHE